MAWWWLEVCPKAIRYQCIHTARQEKHTATAPLVTGFSSHATASRARASIPTKINP